MTFKIADGRKHFYQWDLNRQIIVDDPAIKEVHFCNRDDDCSLVVEVENGIANVPNILLQKSFSIRVFAYDGYATLFDKVFEVKARTRPADYVYEETDILSVRQLEEELRKEITETLEEIEGGLITDGFATKEYVDEAVSNVSVDLSGYAKESYVDEAIAQVVSEHETDLVEYAKKTDIPDVSDFITSIPSEYVTESELNSKGYLTQHQDISGKADKNHTHSEYAKTKHTHDMADVNGLQLAISERATQEDIDRAIELHNHNDLYAAKEHNHDDKYATRGHVHSYNDLSDKPEIPSVEGLASEAYVNAAIANIELPESGDVDLTGYATEAWVEGKGYLTESQDAVTLDVTGIAANETAAPEAAVAFARAYINGEYNNRAIFVLRDGKHNPATISHSNGIVRLRLADYVTSDGYVGRQEYSIHSVTAKWRSLSEGFYLVRKTALNDYYTKEEVDEAIANIEIPEGGEGADLSNYYTKEETAQAIQDALDAIGVAEGGAY